jgi:hypothetical protein
MWRIINRIRSVKISGKEKNGPAEKLLIFVRIPRKKGLKLTFFARGRSPNSFKSYWKKSTFGLRNFYN